MIALKTSVAKLRLTSSWAFLLTLSKRIIGVWLLTKTVFLCYFYLMECRQYYLWQAGRNRAVSRMFNRILRSPLLTWGAKVLCFAVMALPKPTIPINAKLARKLKAHPSTITKWMKEIMASEFREILQFSKRND